MLRKIRSPKFWHNSDSILSKLLTPISNISFSLSKMMQTYVQQEKMPVPVISIGSAIISGAGKTPTVGFVCKILQKQGYNPHILTTSRRGYIKNVLKVQPDTHSYLQVGSESLLLAQNSITWIGNNRISAGKAAINAGADILIIDDGFKNNSIIGKYKILVIDTYQQFGNNKLLPAGPLVVPSKFAIQSADIVLLIGDKNIELEQQIKSIKEIDIAYAKLSVSKKLSIENKKIIAFCGLGNPIKFQNSLIECKYEIIDFIAFANHHTYTITELHKLIQAAKSTNATLITTAKDYIKIPEIFKQYIKVLEIKLQPENNVLENKIIEYIKEFQK